jgi:hypothetical protein
MADPLVIPNREDVLEARSRGAVGPIIESTLAVLVGEPLEALVRTGDMIVLGFGPKVIPKPIRLRGDIDPERRARLERRNAKPLARYRLHIQCPFRLDSPNGPFVGGHDMFYEADPPHRRIDGGPNRDLSRSLFDRRVKEGSDLEGPPLMTLAIQADRGGGLVLELTEDWKITVAPASAIVREHWRFFDTTSDGHFVVFQEPEDSEPGKAP